MAKKVVQPDPSALGQDGPSIFKKVLQALTLQIRDNAQDRWLRHRINGGFAAALNDAGIGP